MLETQTNPHRPWLHRFAVLLVIATFALLALGGTVTSKGVGLSVPDWPTTYDHNMFLFPTSLWIGGIFWEHTHRLLASLVGLMTIILTAWLWVTQRTRPWLRRFGVALLALVIVQGVMGGLRVTQYPSHLNLAITLAIIHGIAAQLFLCGTILIAAATGRFWQRHSQANRPMRLSIGVRKLALILFIAMVVQLTLGAAMRHTGSGLAIPDFPSSYGGVLPPLTQQGIADAADRVLPEDTDVEVYPLPLQVGVHFAHRVWAVVVVCLTLIVLAKAAALAGIAPSLQRISFAMMTLLLIQIALGASVIWSGKHPEIATAHQVTGAALLGLATLMFIRLCLIELPVAQQQTRTTLIPAGAGGAGA